MFTLPTVYEGSFICKSIVWKGRLFVEAVSAQAICNGLDDCSEGTDEIGCSTVLLKFLNHLNIVQWSVKMCNGQKES